MTRRLAPSSFSPGAARSSPAKRRRRGAEKGVWKSYTLTAKFGYTTVIKAFVTIATLIALTGRFRIIKATLDDLFGVPGVIAGKFTVVGWPKTKVFGQGFDGFISALKSMLVPSRISQGFWPPYRSDQDGARASTKYALQGIDYKLIGAYRAFSATNAWSPSSERPSVCQH